MPLRTVAILALSAAIALFAAANWSAFTAPTRLTLGFAAVEAPLGLIMLGATLLLGVLFLVSVVYLQGSALLEARRHARELQAERERAENAEASRAGQLREHLDRELQKLRQLGEQARAEVLEKLAETERELRAAIEESTNALAASLEELEDRLEREVEERDRSRR
ncbi:MAG TPA: LapA family protein [candidate division Zixibacteria bacterium]|nr:LapA family protein [candidate division Zixibacteria bacterium]